MPFTCSIIIPVFNQWALTRQCLLSLKQHTQGQAYEVIVVDNGSCDATREALPGLGQELFAQAFVLQRLAENRNFAPACNLAARTARAPFLFFLNNDTLLFDNCLLPLLKALQEEQDLVAVGSRLLYPDQSVQHVGIAFTPKALTHLYRFFPGNHPVVLKQRTVQALTAAALLLAKDDFWQYGGFCEEYRNGFEDVDFCLRLKQSGRKLKLIPSSALCHLESQSQGRKDCDAANAALFQARCGDDFYPDYHLHGLRDGFVPFLTESFDLALALSEADEERLLRETEQRSPEAWKRAIQSNPLWIAGRRVFAECAEQQGNYALAISLFAEVAFLRQRKSDYLRLLALEDHALGDNQRLFDRAHQEIRRIDDIRKDLSYAKAVFRQVQKSHDRFLCRLYEQELLSLQRQLAGGVS
ncbi:MAG: glycosyltransferase family 2 protein [Desulfovibrio sp.]|nr:glycosyltransferase family 2 protein [Desulfovibrio sp.]